MNSSAQKSFAGNSGGFEDTLRLIASLPAPEGLVERVEAGLRTNRNANSSKGRILSWPTMPRLSSNWMRSAAAAAIVCVVVGGGWGVYSRVKPAQQGKVLVMPRAGVSNGFSNAGAMRTPQTLNGPVVTHTAVKAVAPGTPAVVRHGKLAATGKAAPIAKAAPQAVAPAVK